VHSLARSRLQPMSHQPDNIFAGTQVVSRVEVRGPNHSLVHPRGAVGVVTSTPAVSGENYLVRFPGGFEKTLEPSQIIEFHSGTTSTAREPANYSALRASRRRATQGE
jgi:hypothetical protein